jgi:glycosyltransferase involved in cell wall biosynthesis
MTTKIEGNRSCRDSRGGIPLVSVIVPTYNYGHFILQALRSIQAQTYHQWECIIVDDGSTDNTGATIAQCAHEDSRIKYIYQKNRGTSSAKNIGVINSSGKYLQFLDADDLIEPKKFALQVEILEKNPTFDIVYGNMRYFKTADVHKYLYSLIDENEPWMPEISGKGEEVLPALIRENIMVINSPVIRKSVIDDVGLFDENFTLLEDWDFWIRCAFAGKWFQYADLESTLALVRFHQSSASRKDNRQMLAANLMLQGKISAMTGDNDILNILLNKTKETEVWRAWYERIDLAKEELEEWMPPGSSFILVDEDKWGEREIVAGRRRIPFMERNGQYWGIPPDDKTAISEFERLRQESGANFMVFAWPAFWWFEYYSGFYNHLRSLSECILKNEHLIVFRLHN